MIQQRTVFVVGAGASAEYKFPVARGLAADLSKRLDIRHEFEPQSHITGDQVLYNIFKQLTVGNWQQACLKIRDGTRSSPSIDTFLDNHSNDELVVVCGKLAIARSIIEYEGRAGILKERGGVISLDYDAIDNTWIHQLFMTLIAGTPVTKVNHLFENVGFLVFNYDRCLEEILARLTGDHYAMTYEKAAQIVAGARIVHPYGSVGKLPWENRVGESVIFGSTDYRSLENVSKSISTYSENIKSDGNASDISELVGWADRIVFLGFSYLRPNMELMNGFEPNARKEILGTTYGMSQRDVNTANSIIAQLGWSILPSLQLSPVVGCSKFIEQHSRYLQS